MKTDIRPSTKSFLENLDGSNPAKIETIGFVSDLENTVMVTGLLTECPHCGAVLIGQDNEECWACHGVFAPDECPDARVFDVAYKEDYFLPIQERDFLRRVYDLTMGVIESRTGATCP
jgi:hypothetical protein